MTTVNKNSDIKAAWKAKASRKEITSMDVVSYSITRAVRAQTNDKLTVARGLLLTAFSPITNSVKLANGAKPYQSLRLSLIKSAINTVGMDWIHLLSVEDRKIYDQLLTELMSEVFTPESDITYAYIFTRQDIHPAQQVVQTAHAAMCLGQRVSRNEIDGHGLHFVVFGLPNMSALSAKQRFLENKNVRTVAFHEPNIGGEVTSFACYPMRRSIADRKRLFRDDVLLDFNPADMTPYSVGLAWKITAKG